jgi:hypothetical protein
MQATQHPRPKSQRWKWLAWFAAALFLLAVVLSLPTFRGTSEDNPGAKNLARLKKIGAACRLYAMDNGGAYPNSLEQLDPDYLSTVAQQSLRYFDPISRTRSNWIYLPGYTAQSPAATIILAAPRAAPNGYRLVLRADITSAFVSEQEYPAQLAAQAAR